MKRTGLFTLVPLCLGVLAGARAAAGSPCGRAWEFQLTPADYMTFADEAVDLGGRRVPSLVTGHPRPSLRISMDLIQGRAGSLQLSQGFRPEEKLSMAAPMPGLTIKYKRQIQAGLLWLTPSPTPCRFGLGLDARQDEMEAMGPAGRVRSAVWRPWLRYVMRWEGGNTGRCTWFSGIETAWALQDRSPSTERYTATFEAVTLGSTTGNAEPGMGHFPRFQVSFMVGLRLN